MATYHSKKGNYMPAKTPRNKKNTKTGSRRPVTTLLVVAALLVAATSVFMVARTNAAITVNPPTSLRASVLSHSKIALNWLPSTSTPSPTYNIYRDGVQIGVMGVWISLDGSVTYTDTSVAPSTTYKYYVQAQNSNGTANSATVTATTPAAPTADQLGTVTGVVRDKRKNPVPGATVSIVYYGQSNKVTTNADGSYSLPGVPAGNYTMSVTASGYISTTKKITVVGGSSISVDLALRQR